jgi:catechol-2,3-dioxygenase
MEPTRGANVAHWVLKIGSLKTSMEFFENILGLRVLRHEEFATGCEATCNGPYGGITMLHLISPYSCLSND